MMHHLRDVRGGFDVSADAVVVGSGAAGAVAAANLVEAGYDTVLLEAGPELQARDMTRDGPRFMARYLWDGGMRMIAGSSQIPSMQGRCLGGSTVMNSAIMLPLPDRVRRQWAREDGLDFMLDAAIDRSFARIFHRTGVTPTPLAVMGRRNLIARDALDAMGVPNGPLPRAVIDCKGCADCITGCFEGKKQSVDRSWVPAAVDAGLRVFTCSQVERVLTHGDKVTGVSGEVIDIDGWVRCAPFKVHAPLVVMAPGVMATPCILIKSGINPRGRVGSTLNMHLTGGVVAIMDEVVEPWVGASQGWGAIHPDIEGMKLESLWAAPSLIAVKWGGIGETFLRQLQDVKNAALLVCVYAGRTSGSVKPKRNGMPRMRLHIPDEEIRPIQRVIKQCADGFLDVGAREIHSMIPGVKAPMRTKQDTEELLSTRIKPRDVSMTGNHVFGSVRMSADARRGPVDLDGRVRGVDGLYVVDTSIFPGPSNVNPQATVMVMADVLTRRLAELAL